MLKKWEISIPEFEDSTPRNIYLYLPSSYCFSRKRYPVLYMFDGHNVFTDADATYGKSWGLKNYLDKTKTELIVVALECSHTPDHGRLKEYSPFTFQNDSMGLIQGRGRTTMEWFIHVLKPYMDQHYRTLRDRDHTLICGSSMGGLMSLYAVLKYNHIFGRAAALSPSLWTAPEKIASLIDRSRVHPGTILYMDYGTEEFKNHEGMIQLFFDTVHQFQEKQICLTSRIVPSGTHCEASWEKQLPLVIHTLLYET